MKYGFINKTGEEVIECKYDDASDFHEGLARVKFDGEWCYINCIADIVLKSGLTKIPNKVLESSNQEKLKAIVDTIRNSDHVSLYYDLIVDGNRFSFSTLEEREQFEKDQFEKDQFEKDQFETEQFIVLEDLEKVYGFRH